MNGHGSAAAEKAMNEVASAEMVNLQAGDDDAAVLVLPELTLGDKATDEVIGVPPSPGFGEETMNAHVTDIYGGQERRVAQGLTFLSEGSQGTGTQTSITRKVSIQDGKEVMEASEWERAPTKIKKMGTLMGVFVPCTQNILGIILFVRLSWIVGQAGIGFSLLIVLLCCSTTFLTALSLSAIATNGAIKGGGPYYLISRALGPEFGGSVGLCFYLGTTVAGAMYILGAVETLKLSLWPDLNLVGDCPKGSTSQEASCSGCDRWDYSILGFLILCACTSLVACGVKYVSVVSPLFLLPVLITVVCMWLGFFSSSARSDFATGPNGEEWVTGHWDISQNFGPAWPADEDTQSVEGDEGESSSCDEANFFSLLALFFPSVTGIMAGSNRSGDLKNAQQSIPKGTVAAQLMTSFLYLCTTIFYGCVATRTGLKEDYLLSATVAWPHEVVVRVGIVLSTLGAGLQSLTGAPRLLQAIANDNLIPALKWFQGVGEPRRPLMLTFMICAGCIIPGKIDVVAPIITMFFLLCYSAVNAAVLMQELLREPNWRPRFKFHHASVSLLGLTLCLFIMFSTQWYFALAAILVVGLLYKYVEYRKVAAHWGDGMRGMRYQRARQALLELEKISSVHTKNWRPQAIIFVKTDAEGALAQPNVLDFIGQLKGARGITILSTAIEGDLVHDAQVQMRIESRMRQLRDEHHIKGFTQVVMTRDMETALDSLLQTAGLGGLGPNTAVTLWPDSWRSNIIGAARMKQILTSAYAFNMALILVRGIESWPKPKLALHTHGRSETIDVWWVVHDGGLLLLLSIILRKHRVWHHCPIRVFCVCHKEDDPIQLYDMVKKFLYGMRIEAKVKCVQLIEGEGLSGILPVRAPKTWSDATLKAGIVAQPLGQLQTVSRFDHVGHENMSAPSPRVAARSNRRSVQRSGSFMVQSAGKTASEEVDARMATTMAFNKLMQKYSKDSGVVMTNLPVPRKEESTEDYMRHLEALMDGIKRGLLVAGQRDADVITMFS
mmetsp:Transcript_6967/g.11707  ORF Transcript_6967/g.11707 Transcript_6967/m.11707 type:complete len:1007 (-) Transcript_6967:338-3358(-)|eukprot:CAMPEP_0119316206 /NCGR_PEP_ID=MMETSP1333-20130426/39006_1 /TAXON_ID=418940 /ORGANISM="Scyphosphaera apsteinii, Strain RCC1455" /LENGTH=1006 /DNA_ID=CAMNT_0007321795 /DNA_START=54 /DNA_END=3074 /DNA_ORIENTATION=-